MKKLLIAIACATIGFGNAYAATFNCAKARTFSAKTICNNPELSALDDQFGEIYASVANKVGNTEEFKQIGRANVALRNQCQNEACVRKWIEDSINLYSYLFENLKPDYFAQMPAESKELCANAMGSLEQSECGSAQIDFLDKKIEALLSKIQALKVPEEDKQECLKIFEKGKKDRQDYCSFLETAYSEGTIAKSISDCEVEWTIRLEDLLQTKLYYLQNLVDFESASESSKSEEPAQNP